MATICIGDVHGAGLELQKLIDTISPRNKDEIYLIGDMFDRAQHGTLVWELIQKFNMKCLLGNHEKKMLHFLKGQRSFVPSHYHYFLNSLIWKEKLISRQKFEEWLEKLPEIIVKDDFILAHAGVNPYYAEGKDTVYNVYGGPRDKVPWYEKYTGTKTVIYGHQSCPFNVPFIKEGPNFERYSVRIDTGVAHGGPITAYFVEDKYFVQFRSGVDHYSDFKKLGYVEKF